MLYLVNQALCTLLYDWDEDLSSKVHCSMWCRQLLYYAMFVSGLWTCGIVTFKTLVIKVIKWFHTNMLHTLHKHFMYQRCRTRESNSMLLSWKWLVLYFGQINSLHVAIAFIINRHLLQFWRISFVNHAKGCVFEPRYWHPFLCETWTEFSFNSVLS